MTKIKPILFKTEMVQAILNGSKTQTRRKNNHPYFSEEELLEHTLPAYEKGDILWVRETFEFVPVQTAPLDLDSDVQFKIKYKADSSESFNKWKPSIHMPKEAARIFLEVTDVRLERLQDISEADAADEGVTLDEHGRRGYTCYLCDSYLRGKGGHVGADYLCRDGIYLSTKESFHSLWLSIHGPGSWEANPFVWVYEFKQTEKPKNFLT